MGGVISSVDEEGTPNNICEFRRLDASFEDCVIPEVPEKRQVTDQKFLVAFGLAFLCFLPFFIYGLVQSNLNVLTPPTYLHQEASSTGDYLTADLSKNANNIVALCCIGLGYCVVMLFLFRYFVAYVVWFVIIGTLLCFIAFTAVLWYISILEPLAIACTITSVILAVLVAVLAKKIAFVIGIFKESMRIISGVPLILFEPLLTFLALAVLLTAFVFFTVCFVTAVSLEDQLNGVIRFTIFYHSVLGLWMYEFILGCQYMVISGVIANLYFCRDKSTLQSPIYRSFYNVVRFHLGSVAFGSLVLTVAAVVRGLVRKMIKKSTCLRDSADSCSGILEQLLRFLSKNAYIQTAMHGRPFFESGKRAARLLLANALSTIAVNSIGHFVIIMAQGFIIVATALTALAFIDTKTPSFPIIILIGILVTAVITKCFFTVIGTTIDTVFICFCEDCCMNDGMSQPYFMSTNLMQYMEDAKKSSRT